MTMIRISAPSPMLRTTPRWRSTVLLAVAAIALFSAPVSAQSTGNGYLFSTPSGTLNVRVGYAQPNGKSDLFAFVQQQLTLSKRSFGAPHVGVDITMYRSPRMQWMFSTEFMGRAVDSEFRDFVAEDDQPITQTTQLMRVPITGGLRLNLMSAGEPIGSMAWIPRKIVPYVGAGGGLMLYYFNQAGEFVDPETLDIYEDRFESRGWAPVAHALAGFDVSLTARYALSTEGRYTWGSGKLGRDFVGFDKLDLSGLSVSTGLSIRF